MHNKLLYIILSTLFVLTSCNNSKDMVVDYECYYETESDYQTDLGFTDPLFYNELEPYNYNGVEMDGFYFIGETKGDVYIRTREKYYPNPRGDTFVVNDKYNILGGFIMKEEGMDKVTKLDDDSITYNNKENVDQMIEENIISNLLYEYYESDFDEINSFLKDNDISNFWEYEKMKCGRRNLLLSTPLNHPNSSEYVHIEVSVNLSQEDKDIIALAIKTNNISTKTNLALKQLVERLILSDNLNYERIDITVGAELKDRYTIDNADSIVEKGEYGLKYTDDTKRILNKLEREFEGHNLTSPNAITNGVYLYIILYENGYQLNYD